MVVFATPERRDISSMVSSSSPASVSRSSVVVRTRSRETSTRGSRDSSRGGTARSSVVLAFAIGAPRPFGIDESTTLQYRSATSTYHTREEGDTMDFASIRMISDDLESVVNFYEQVTGVPAIRPAPVFAEIHL